jgi:O-antigen/teichoic acid export membrane protein
MLRRSAKPASQSPVKRDPLSTGHLMGDLGRRTTSSALVTTVAQGIKFATNLVSTLVLARLLDPQDFGLVAMVTAVTGFLEVLKDAGLSTATVQRQDITQAQVSNLFWANLALGFVITALVAASSPALAWFYNEPRLTAVAIAVSITFLLTASTVQHQAIMRRQMRFTAIAVIQVVPALVGLAVAIAMANTGWGYWSLVGTALAAAACNCVVTWLLSDWRPGLPVRGAGTWGLLRFGANLTGAAIVQAVISTADTLLIGRFYGAASVGLYSRGAALLLNPLQQFLSPFNAVLVPALSRMQHDPERYRRAFLQIQNTNGLLALPFAGFLLGSAHPLILVLLGEKWSETTPIFSAFSIAAIYLPLAGATTWLFTSQGRGRETLTTSVITASISLLSILAGLPFGPVGVALSYSLTGLLLRLPILFHYAGRNGPVRTRDLWFCLLINLPLGILVFLTALGVQRLWPLQSAFVQLCIAIPSCALCAGLFVFASPSHRRIASDAVERFRAALARRGTRNTPAGSASSLDPD